jgi:hypothetical protein
MARRQAIPALVLAVLVGAGCAGPPRQAGSPAVQIAHRASLQLPAGAELTAQLDAVQLLVVEHGGERQLLQAYIELRPGRVVLVILDRIGVFLHSIEYDGSELVVRRGTQVPDAWPDGMALADFLLAFQPLEAVAGSLRGATIEQSADRRLRRVRRGSRTVIEIRYAQPDPWSGPVQYLHLERGYRMEIETVERSAP